ncbi:MAG: hypothetical protein Q9179_007739 [Wetmoreana sp. 5 TL-2023]
MHMIRLIPPSVYMTNLHNSHRYRQARNYHPGSSILPEIDNTVSSVIRLHKVNTIWDSAAGPYIDKTVFAVGNSKGAIAIGLVGNTAQTWEQKCDWPGDEQAAETLAVDFWGPDVVLAGMRSGKVRMWDLRSNGANVRFQHSTCVVNVRGLDQNQILVAGLKDKLCIYDARFIKTFPQSQQAEALPASRPVHTFPTYRRNAFVYPRLGFDVYKNFVASGTEDKKVQIFDLHSSRELAVGSLAAPPTVEKHARCLKFVEDESTGDGLRLLVGNGHRIDAWAW